MTSEALDLNDPDRTVRLDSIKALPYFANECRDDRSAVHFQRELEHVKAQVYEVKYPAKKMGAGEILPIRSTVPRGAETWVYYQFDHLGVAKWLTSASWADMPTAEATGTETVGRTAEFGIGYQYSLSELERSAFVGRSLPAMKAMATRKASIQKHHEIGLYGAADKGLQGLLNLPAATVVDASAAAAGSNPTRWDDASKTADEILADLNSLIDDMLALTNDVHRPTSILMPRRLYRALQTRYVGSGASEQSILARFRADNPEIRRIEVLIELDTASRDGNAAVIAFEDDPDALWYEAPIPFEQGGVQQSGYSFQVPTRSTSGGVICVYPLSVIRMDFAAA